MSIGQKELAEFTDNRTVYNRARRRELSCSLCRPNRGENSGRKPKHGEQKSKSHRRKK